MIPCHALGATTPVLCLLAAAGHAQDLDAVNEVEIGHASGGFGGLLEDHERFGAAVARLDDVDGDGIDDLAVGASHDNGGGLYRGAVWVLFLNADGTVREEQELSSTAGGLVAPLLDLDYFGTSVVSPGDLDDDGTPDLAIGHVRDSGIPHATGSVRIVFLNPDGTARAEQVIGSISGGFGGALDTFDHFGAAVAALGDLDGDGIEDLAVSAERDDDGGEDRGAIWILFLDKDGVVQSEKKISSTAGGFGGVLDDNEWFAGALTSIGDLDGDGVVDLAAGTRYDDGHAGAIWVIFLNADGTVKDQQKIGNGVGGLVGPVTGPSNFGAAVGWAGDLDGDGLGELLVGAPQDEGFAFGAVWVLSLDVAGQVVQERRFAPGEGGFDGPLANDDRFGTSVCALGDLDGDGEVRLAVGAYQSDLGGINRGTVWSFEVDPCPAAPSSEVVRLGTPPNPAALLPGVTSPPVIGATWDPVVDHTTFVPLAAVDVLGITAAPANLLVGSPGTLLCDIGGTLLQFPSLPGQPFAVPIPNDLALVGATVCCQAASVDSGGAISLTNALDVTIGKD